MKRSFFPVLLALAIMATSCIKNEESEGVKSMRTSQASLLTAMAGATTTAATADAALKAAQAALSTAQAAIQKAESDAKIAQMAIDNTTKTEANRHAAALNALNESLQVAKDAQTKANLTNQIAQEAATAALNIKMTANQQTMLDAQIAAQKNQNDINVLNAKLALDQAQKDYDLGMQQNAQTYANNLVQLKTQVTTDLYSGYNNAYSAWIFQSDRVYMLKRDLGDLQVRLMNQKASDKRDVDNAKNALDLEKANLVKLNDDLSKFKAALPNTDGITTLIGQYQAEVASLKNADILLSQTSIANLNSSSNLNNQINAINTPLILAQNNAANNVQNAKNYLTAATNNLNNATGLNLVYDFKLSSYFQLQAGYQPKLNGAANGPRVAIKDAVATEKADADANGTYPSPADQKDVVDATELYNTAKKYLDDAQANYDKSFANWQTAHAAYLDAQPKINDLNAQIQTANKAYMDAQTKLSNNNTRIITIGSYISQLTALRDNSNYTDQSTNTTIYYSSITLNISSSEMRIKSLTISYEAEVKSFENKVPINEIYYSEVQGQIDDCKALLANEQTALALLKASLDEWVAKLKAALPKN